MDHLETLRTFCTVVEMQSFTHAAHALGISKTVVSRAISGLETRLGVRLFQRTTRHLALTESGEEFYGGCSRVVAELDVLEAGAGERAREPAGVLRLVAHTTAALIELPPLIAGFRARYPAVQLELTLAERPVDLIKEAFDLGIVLPFMLTSELTITRSLCRLPLAVVGSPSYLQGRKLPQRPNDLAAFRFVTILASISEPQLRFRRGGEQIAVPLEHDVSTNNAALNKELVMSGAGLGVLPLTMVGKELDDGRLVQLLPDFELMSGDAELRLAYRDRSLMTAKVRAFIDYATSYFDARAAQVGHAQRPKTVATGSDRSS
ncbi:LysR family transcriptional regulator [Paraburkholderia sp. BL10I2N1]|uniref:LysR family transcriptional regulator n=1 Tax=Paraburkholderia sp. BL10I2N1 TaxID=1938796 RepID=UPI00105EA621|nr:LysR family transcriptional regulator [Paraburkholderia sp. BL10I2N1]TDN62131.1 DNA-binding transcriptional LysR family regulator [Paraburkholderia sp. BL10I2N1]